MKLEVVGEKLIIDGFVYKKNSKRSDGRVVWECVRCRKSNCRAKAITSNPKSSEKLVLYQGNPGVPGPRTSKHNHERSPKEVKVAKRMTGSKSREVRDKLQDQTQNMTGSNTHADQDPITEKLASDTDVGLVDTTVVARSELNRSNVMKMRIAIEKRPSSPGVPEPSKKRRKKVDFWSFEHYRKFLLKFANNPVFELKPIMDALEGIYKSDVGRNAAFVKILENPEKIMKDLETLKINPSADITAPTNGEGFIGAKTNCAPESADPRATKQTMPMTRSSTEVECGEKISQIRRNLSPDRKNAETIPPMPGAIAIKDLQPPGARPGEYSPPIIEKEFEIKRKIILIDLTGDSDVVKQECSGDKDQTTQPIQKNGSTNTQADKFIWPQVSEQKFVPTIGSVNPFFSYGQNPNMLNPLYNIPNNFFVHTAAQSNIFQNSFHQPLNLVPPNHVPFWLPVMMNIPCMRSDGTMEMKQTSFPMSINQHLAMPQQFQDSKK